MAYHVPTHGGVTNIYDSEQDAQDSSFMEMINEDAYEHDDDAFFEAPEHPDGIDGVVTYGDFASQPQQQRLNHQAAMDIDMPADHAPTTFKSEVMNEDDFPGIIPQQQVYDYDNDSIDAKPTLNHNDTGAGPQKHIPTSGTNNNNLSDNTSNSLTESQTVADNDHNAIFPTRAIKKLRYNTKDEPEGTKNIDKDTGRENYAAAYRASLVKKESQPSQQTTHSLNHAQVKDDSATPPIKTSQSNTPEFAFAPPDLIRPNPGKDIPRVMQEHHRFHDRVLLLKPALELAPHRYWVAVLNPSLQPKNATKTDQFIWFKANRLITIETVWKIYSAATLTEDFVFLMAGVQLEWEEQLEGVDFFSDKFIVLRVYENGEPGYEGKPITEGLIKNIPEVIELD